MTRPEPPATNREPARVVLLQTTIPAYRQAVIDELEAQLGGSLSILCGEEGFEPTVRLEASHPRLRILENRFFAGRRLLWQSGGLRRLLSADVVVLELNPRVVSTWTVLVARRALGRRTVLWGHAWPRRGQDARSEPIRHTMRRLADAIVVYTETQAVELRRRMPRTKIVAAPNALYPLALAATPATNATPCDVVFSGRLIGAKKPLLLLHAFLAALDVIPEEIRLVFVGDGPVRSELERTAAEARALDRVSFLGPITGYAELQDVYARALCSASPGYVGLSLIQSLWFGVPVIVARDEPHSPEIEAAVDGETSIVVESDSVESLKNALVRLVERRDEWIARRPSIAAACFEKYSVEAMVSSMISALDH